MIVCAFVRCVHVLWRHCNVYIHNTNDFCSFLSCSLPPLLSFFLPSFIHTFSQSLIYSFPHSSPLLTLTSFFDITTWAYLIKLYYLVLQLLILFICYPLKYIFFLCILNHLIVIFFITIIINFCFLFYFFIVNIFLYLFLLFFFLISLIVFYFFLFSYLLWPCLFSESLSLHLSSNCCHCHLLFYRN